MIGDGQYMRLRRKKGESMKSLIVNNLSLSDFVKQNKKKLYEEGRKNVKLDKSGKPTISRNDPWFLE